MDPLHLVGQPIKHRSHAVLAYCSCAFFHFVVSQIIQKPNRAGFDSRKNVPQPGCAAGRCSCSMGAKRRRAAATSSTWRNQGSGHLQLLEHYRSIELEEKRRVVFLVRSALVEQTSQLVYKFSPRIEITLQLSDLFLRSGNLFCRLLVEHCGDDVEFSLYGFVRRRRVRAESSAATASLFCNSSINDLGESLRRPNDADDCDLFVLN